MSKLLQKLDENSSEHSRWEHDLLFLRQQLQASATRDIQHGLAQSGAETLAIEGELAQVTIQRFTITFSCRFGDFFTGSCYQSIRLA